MLIGFIVGFNFQIEFSIGILGLLELGSFYGFHRFPCLVNPGFLVIPAWSVTGYRLSWGLNINKQKGSFTGSTMFKLQVYWFQNVSSPFRTQWIGTLPFVQGEVYR